MAVFRVYKDSKGEYRWRLRASNNRIVADSGEGYKQKEGVLRDVDFVKEYAPGAKVEDVAGRK